MSEGHSVTLPAPAPLAAGKAERRGGAALRTGLLIALAAGLAGIAFSGALRELVTRWMRQEEYSHGFIIPLIVIGLLWARRDALRAGIGRPAWSGLLVLLVAALMHVVGLLSSLFLLSQVGFVLALVGIVLAIGGTSLLRVTLLPIVFLLFAIPLPYFLDTVLSLRLQLLSSELGVFFIRLFGVPVYLEGNVIDLGVYKLQVVDACSGLRYLYPLLSLGFLAAYLFQAPLWQRALVFLSTIPITVFMNSFRIGLIGVLVDRWGPQMAEGVLHFFEGWVIFLACAALLALEIWILARLSGKRFFQVFYFPKVQAPAAAARRPEVPARSAGLEGPFEARPAGAAGRAPQGDAFAASRSGWARLAPVAGCLVLLLAMGAAAFAISERAEIVPDRTRFVAFPRSIGAWQGHPSELTADIEQGLGLEDYILSDFVQPKRNGAVNLYVAYYASQRNGYAPHSPMVCIPGGGWLITRFDRTTYADDAIGLSMPFNRAVIERSGSRQLVYYWFVQRGRRIANEYWSKWYLLRDAMLLNRTDGALVRLTTPIAAAETEAQAEARLRSFLRELDPVLSAYLPAAPAAGTRSVTYQRRGGQT
jgi:EpsI family protein